MSDPLKNNGFFDNDIQTVPKFNEDKKLLFIGWPFLTRKVATKEFLSTNSITTPSLQFEV